MKKHLPSIIIAAFMAMNCHAGQVSYTTEETQDRLDGNYPSLSVAGGVSAETVEFTATNLFNDLRFPFAAVDLPGLGADPTASVISNCIYTLVFAQNDYLFFSPQMSHDYWDGTVLRPHLHSISTGTPITNTYNLVYSYADIGDVFTAPQTNTVIISTSGIAGEHELHNLGDMDALGTLGGTEVSSMVGVKLIRTDAGTGINLLEFDIHYRIQYSGGQQYTP